MFTADSSPRKKETARQRSIDIERWLKNKFREGFHGMKSAFEDIDTEKSGVVRFFLKIGLQFIAESLQFKT